MKFLLAKLYRYGYPVAVVWWFITRPTTEGVRCIIKSDDKVLLIKHTYGKSWYTVPGGGRRETESIEAAAARESREEVGVLIQGIKIIASLPFDKEYKKDTIHICTAEAITTEIKIDTAELSEAGWYSVDNLPSDLSPVIAQHIRN